MPRRHIGQLAKDFVTLLLVEGEGLKTGGFQMVVGNALALGVLLHGAEQAGAPAVAADAFVNSEPVDVQPAPLDVGDDTALYLALFILDKAGDPLALQCSWPVMASLKPLRPLRRAANSSACGGCGLVNCIGLPA